MRIFVTGFMGSGKTTAGKKLAAKLKLQFLDLDDLIEKRYGKSINAIFEEEGEESFRKKEHAVLEELSQSDNFILATGGGAPCHYDNMELINRLGISVYLKMTPEALFSRLKEVRQKRPLIKHLDDEELKNYIIEKLMERERYYKKAHIIADGLNIDIKKLIVLIKKK
jgi:shikimate kinase